MKSDNYFKAYHCGYLEGFYRALHIIADTIKLEAEIDFREIEKGYNEFLNCQENTDGHDKKEV